MHYERPLPEDAPLAWGLYSGKKLLCAVCHKQIDLGRTAARACDTCHLICHPSCAMLLDRADTCHTCFDNEED